MGQGLEQGVIHRVATILLNEGCSFLSVCIFGLGNVGEYFSPRPFFIKPERPLPPKVVVICSSGKFYFW